MSSNTNLGNTPVNQGYVQLIHTGETGGIDGTLRTLYDGDGTASDLQIASNKVKVSTELYIGSKTATEFIQDIVGDMFTTGSYTNITTTYDDTNGNIDLSASGEVTLTGSQTLSNKTLASPTFTGDINFNDATSPSLTITDSTNTAQLRLTATDTTTDIGSLSAHKVNFRYNNDIRVQLEDSVFKVNAGSDDMNFVVRDTSGVSIIHADAALSRIGIRDGSPSYTLDVNGTGRFTGAVQLDDNLTVAGNLVADSIDVAGDLTLDADGADIILKDGGTEYGRLSQVLGGLTLKSGSSGANAVVFSSDGNTAIFAGGVQISGDLTVQGDTTTLNTATLQVEDKNIVMNYHATNDTSGSADGAGITIQDAVNSTTDATMLWDATNDEFDFSHTVTAPNFTGNLTGNVTGNASGLSSTLGVSSGGTGATTLTSNAILTGNGTSAIQAESYLTFDGTSFEVENSSNGRGVQLNTNSEIKSLDGASWLHLQRYVDGNVAVGSNSNSDLYVANQLGVGTSSPAQKLDISDTTPVLRLTDSSSGVIDTAIGTIEFYSADTSGNYPAVGASIKAMTESSFGSSHGLAFLTNADSASPTERMRIDEQGNVGIGVTNPSRKLQVAGAIELSTADNTLDTNNFALRRDSGGGGNIDVPGSMTINLDANNNETTAQFEICHDGGSTPVFKVQENGYTTALRYYLEDTGAVIYRNNNDLELITYSGYDINLMPSGNVGIGTTSPGAKLHIAEGFAYIYKTDDVGKLELRDSRASYDAEISQRSDGRISLATRAGTYGSNGSIEILDSGNVGIGTTSPSTKLHIQGSAVSGSSSDANSLLTLTNNANNSIQINSSSSSAGQIRFGHNSSNYRGAMTYYHSSNILGFTTSGTERVRIDTTGAKFSENFGSTDDVLHIAPSNGGNRTMTIDGQKIDVTFTNSGGSTGLELQGNGGATTFGGAVSGITTLSTSSSITTGYGVAFTNGNTNFLQYNNALEDVLYLRDTTNGEMLLTYGTTRTTIHKNTRHGDQVEFEDTNAVINRVSNDLEIRTYSGYDINLMAAGNVGIGTSSPSRTLDVDGIIRSNTAGGRFEAISGTSGTGYYIFGDSGDLDIGWISYEHTNNAMAFKVNASERMRIDSSGNVGIGTQSPGAYLHTEGASSGTESYAKFSTGSAAGDQILTVKSSSSRNHMALQVNTGAGATDDLALNPDGGNVGIGTTSPGSILHIGTGNTSRHIKVSDNRAMFGYNANFAIVQGGSTKGIKFNTNTDTFGGSPKMTITTAGDVGIGTESPAHEMVLRKDQAAETEFSIVNLTSDASAATNLRFRNSTSGSETGNGALIQLDNYNSFFINNQFGNPLKFGTNNTERMRIDGSGNVGIGTTSPSVKLDVAGGDIAIDATQKLYLDGGTHTYIDEVNSDQLRLVAGGTEVLKGYSGGAIDMYGGSINRSINIGANRTADAASFIDLVGDTTYTDYGARLIRNSGANAITDLTHRGTGALRLRCQDAGAVLFMISDAEKMRVASSGNVGIGTTSPSEKLDVVGSAEINGLLYVSDSNDIPVRLSSTDADFAISMADSNSASATHNRIGVTTNDMKFFTNNVEALRIDSTQDAHFDQDVIAFSTTPSDIRLKENFEKIENGLDIVSQLEGHTFNWKKGGDRLSAGFKAQEVEKILPHLVDEKKLPLRADDDKEYKILRYEEMIPYLVEAIKEQQQQINKLEEKLNG